MTDVTEPKPGDASPQLALLTIEERAALNIFGEFIANRRHWSDEVAKATDDLSHAMLRLFDRGYNDLPDPVEMWAGLSTDGTAIVGGAWDVPRETVPNRVRGVFIPIERLEPAP